jgi:hypothetical protein
MAMCNLVTLATIAAAALRGACPPEHDDEVIRVDQREREAIEIVLATLVDEVSLHEAGKSDGTSESGRTQAEEVPVELRVPNRNGGRFRCRRRGVGPAHFGLGLLARPGVDGRCLGSPLSPADGDQLPENARGVSQAAS